jgi:hypothetical protein
MAYNKRNLLTRIIKIQLITLEHTQRGTTQVWVYRNIIRSQFMLSERTFKKYMCINAKAELKKLESNENIQKKRGGNTVVF